MLDAYLLGVEHFFSFGSCHFVLMRFQQMITLSSPYPKLRALDIRPHLQAGQPYLLLRDPQQITAQALLVPQGLASLLALCDGSHTVEAISAAARSRLGAALTPDRIVEFVNALDQAYMLDNARYLTARAQVLDTYRRASARLPALAGLSYPNDKTQLWRQLQDYLESADNVEPLAIDWTRPFGLLSPHIDYGRGGKVYAQVWKRAAHAVREAELVIILGTDHYGSDLFTLTHQNYATPYGTLPTDQTLVDALAAAIGPEAAFAGELRHRGEHSLELVAVWLHHMRAGEPCAVVPMLCGGFHHFLYNGAQPKDDATIADVIAVLQQFTRGRRAVVIASGDLAHVGPAFGGAPLNAATRAQLQLADQTLLNHMCRGDVEGFFGEIRRVRDGNNVCGVSPIYLTMRTLAATTGEPVGYGVCPADEVDTSVVTVGGMIFQGGAVNR